MIGLIGSVVSALIVVGLYFGYGHWYGNHCTAAESIARDVTLGINNLFNDKEIQAKGESQKFLCENHDGIIGVLVVVGILSVLVFIVALVRK